VSELIDPHARTRTLCAREVETFRMSQDETNEVELSTQELASLAQPKIPAASAQAAPSSKAPPSRDSSQKMQHSLAARRSLSTYFVLPAAALVLIAVGIAIAMRTGDWRNAQNIPRWQPLPDRGSDTLADEREETIFDTRAPVRVRNEFDRSEVFEFPPGTSRQEAREQVAQILLQRAIERQQSSSSRDGATPRH
jgi:hypothetical protein